jgi:hypothetical protein
MRGSYEVSDSEKTAVIFQAKSDDARVDRNGLRLLEGYWYVDWKGALWGPERSLREAEVFRDLGLYAEYND